MIRRIGLCLLDNDHLFLFFKGTFSEWLYHVEYYFKYMGGNSVLPVI